MRLAWKATAARMVRRVQFQLLKIPALTMADGPAGVRIAGSNPVNEGNATAMPAPIALAATWDVKLATSYGDILGDESFATGHNVLLGPAIDIVRAARGFETLLDAVSNGQVPQEILDRKMRHILRPMFEHKLFDQPVQIGAFDAQAHGVTARTIAEQSIVLRNCSSLSFTSPSSSQRFDKC
jgi:beta-glucosidase-like glycosyl hydrolase